MKQIFGALGKGFTLSSLVVIGALASAPVGMAGDSTSKSLEERHHDRARVLRERSEARTGANLSRESTITDQRFDRRIDFYALGLQIKRLGDMIHRLANPVGATDANVSPAPGTAASPPNVKNIYGPDGPTEKSVRLLLEYRLMVGDNPRLKVGSVKEKGTKIIARVTTTDGSLVERYAIDKEIGAWAPMR